MNTKHTPGTMPKVGDRVSIKLVGTKSLFPCTVEEVEPTKNDRAVYRVMVDNLGTVTGECHVHHSPFYPAL